MTAAATPPAAISSEPTSIEARSRAIDARLVRRCRGGDESAWTAIVERFSNYVYAIALRFGCSDDKAEDVFQEVFARVFTHLGTLRDDGALKPWIAQLTRRAAIDRLRADAHEIGVPDDEEVLTEGPDLEQIEQAMAVHRALDALPAPTSDVLRRFFLYDQSYRTIGDALGIPPGTVASRISRGLSALRTVLDPGCAS